MASYSALIIEDVQDLAETFREVLEFTGWQAEYVQDGQVALEKLATEVPDLIMLDLHLPYVSGLEILHQIQRDSRFDHTKILVITADAVRARQIEDRVDMVLIKPILGQQLLDVLDQLMPDQS